MSIRPSRRTAGRPALITSAMLLAVTASLGRAGPVMAQDYARTTTGTRILESPGGLSIRVLVEASNLGGSEVEVGEVTFPVGAGSTATGEAQPGGHRHAAVEIFYVLEGTLDHIVNGESHIVETGGIAIVRPGDSVVHRVIGDVPVRALVVWAPGGEVARIAPGFRERPVRANGNDRGGR